MIKQTICILLILVSFLGYSQEKEQQKYADVEETIQSMQGDLDARYDSLLEEWKSNNLTNRLNLLFAILDACPIEDNNKFIPEGYREISNLLDTAQNESVIRNATINQANLLVYESAYAYHLNDNKTELKLFKKELSVRKKVLDTNRISATYGRLNAYYASIGDYKNKLVTLKDAINFFDSTNYLRGLSRMQYQLSLFYTNLDDLDNAVKSLNAALEIEKKIGDSTRITRGLCLIGLFYLQNDFLDTARHYFNACVTRSSKLNDYSNLVQSKFHLGEILYHEGKINEAIIHQEKVNKLAVQLEEMQWYLKSAIELGKYYRKQKKYNKAKKYYDEIIALAEKFGVEQSIAYTKKDLAAMYLEQGKTTDAKHAIAEAIPWIMEKGFPDQKMDAVLIAYKVDSASQNYQGALSNYQKYSVMLSAAKDKEFLLQEAKNNYKKEISSEKEKSRSEQLIKDTEIAKQASQLKSRKKTTTILTVGLSILGALMLFLMYMFKKKAEAQRLIEKQKKQVDAAFDELEEKNTEILDSINYAKRIQSAILPPNKLVKGCLENSFILYKPKDIVAGDFYWLEQKDEKVLFAAADCTGHGVPGAMVSVVCNNALNRSVREYALSEPGQILDKTREIVIQEFEKSEDEVKDGMDIALCSLEGNKLQYAGAHNPLWIIRNGEILETKANKQPIGKFDKQLPYITHTFELKKGDSIYIFSDGYVDQFGGEKGKKFKSKAFKSLLLSIQNKTMEEQRILIDKAFETWRGNLEQIDDVCVIGVRT